MKQTRAFQLGSVTGSVPIAFFEQYNAWYPLHNTIDKKCFIYGKGHVKVGKNKMVLHPLSNPFTAKEVKTVKDQYGYNVALGMIKGWGGSLFHDNSCGAFYSKVEVCNMADLGELYDEYTDVLQEAGDQFIQGLRNHGFEVKNESLWYGENLCFFLERIPIHPLQYVEHSLKGFVRMPPFFDSIHFDELLVRLFTFKFRKENDYSEVDKMTEKIVSVYDRIAYFSSKDVAEKIASVFKMEKNMLKYLESKAKK